MFHEDTYLTQSILLSLVLLYLYNHLKDLKMCHWNLFTPLVVYSLCHLS